MRISVKQMLLVLVVIASCIGTSNAQKKKKIVVTGKVTDYKNNPIKDAFIFLDSTRTKVKTNKKGLYKIKLTPEVKLLTVFSVNHGIIDIAYKGAKVVNFIFPESENIITETELTALGYDFSIYNGKEESYDNYRTIFELLRSRYPNVRVAGESVRIIGGGFSASSGSISPLFFVNGSEVSNISAIAPVDIKTISIERANTSLYGGRAAGGIVKITLKK